MNDIITCQFWMDNTDYRWGEITELPEEGVSIFCSLEGIKELFEKISKQDKKYIVVSGYSDYGLFYQKDHHPNKDISKRVGHIRYAEIASINDGYYTVNVCGAKPTRCDSNDKFSVKIDSLTDSTFNEIPIQVFAWFVANCNVNEAGVYWIPFGMNHGGRGEEILPNYFTTEKKKLLYVNFQDYTLERINLKNYYGQYNYENTQNWLTIEPKSNVPIDDFYKALSEHAFVLCPFGNGLDSYRIYETLACGSTPLIPNCEWSQGFAKHGIPVASLDKLTSLGYTNLSALKEEVDSYRERLNYSGITKTYWKNQLELCKKTLKEIL